MRARSVLLVLLLSLAFGCNESFAQTQERAGFSITPFFQEVLIEEGQEYAVFSLEIANNTSVPVTIRLYPLDFGSLDESGGVAFLGAESNFQKKYGLASWISLEKDAFVVNPQDKQTALVTVINKESLSPGGHYAAILAHLENEKSVSRQYASQVNLDYSLASLIFVKKTGGEIYDLKLKEKNVHKNLLVFPSEMKLRFQNAGNVHVVPRGVVVINDPIGREVARGTLNSESGLILPESFRLFRVPLRKTAFKIIPGYYTINTQYRYDGKADFSSEQEKFFYVPRLFVLIIVALCLLAVLIIGKKKGLMKVKFKGRKK